MATRTFKAPLAACITHTFVGQCGEITFLFISQLSQNRVIFHMLLMAILCPGFLDVEKIRALTTHLLQEPLQWRKITGTES